MNSRPETKNASEKTSVIRLVRNQLIASSTGALTTSLCLTPLDVIKVRLQTRPTTGQKFIVCNGIMDCLCICNNGKKLHETDIDYFKRCWYKKPIPQTPKNGVDAMKSIIKNEGIKNLWSGLNFTVLQSTVSVVIYFSTYEYLRDKFRSMNSNECFKDYVATPLAGSTARAGTAFLINPVEVIRTRLQADASKTVKSEVRTMIKNQTFATGLKFTLLRDIPFTAIYWTINEKIRNSKAVRDNLESVFLKNFISGALAGSIAALITTPFDVMKTRIQTIDGKIQPMSVIIRTGNLNKLFLGWRQRCLRTSFACAIMLGTYEFVKSYLA